MRVQAETAKCDAPHLVDFKMGRVAKTCVSPAKTRNSQTIWISIRTQAVRVPGSILYPVDKNFVSGCRDFCESLAGGVTSSSSRNHEHHEREENSLFRYRFANAAEQVGLNPSERQ